MLFVGRTGEHPDVVKRLWPVGELAELFPNAADQIIPRTPQRCTRRVLGEGRWIKVTDSGNRRQFGAVTLRIEPADVSTVQLEHHWPEALSPAEVDELDLAVLRGVSESPSAPVRHLFGFTLIVEAVAHRAGETGPVAVTLAASLWLPSTCSSVAAGEVTTPELLFWPNDSDLSMEKCAVERWVGADEAGGRVEGWRGSPIGLAAER
jgi:hypothetical protein